MIVTSLYRYFGWLAIALGIATIVAGVYTAGVGLLFVAALLFHFERIE